MHHEGICALLFTLRNKTKIYKSVILQAYIFKKESDDVGEDKCK